MKNIEKLDTVTGLPIYDSFIGIAREELANNFVPGHYVLSARAVKQVIRWRHCARLSVLAPALWQLQMLSAALLRVRQTRLFIPMPVRKLP